MILCNKIKEQTNLFEHIKTNQKSSKVKIIPPSVKRKKEKENLYVIGEQASKILVSIAGQIEDEELKNSLLKLAKNKN